MENVKVIKLSKTKIDIDGIIYVREQPAFRVGDCVSAFKDNADYKIERIDGTWYRGDDYGGGYEAKYLRLATDSEVEAHLIKVAEQKGFFKLGNRFKSIYGDDGIIREIYPYDEENLKYIYFADVDQLYCVSGMRCNKVTCSNPSIYKDGVWATILKKEFPKTKAELKQFVEDYAKSDVIAIGKFLENYEDGAQ